jgi:hypothetical protein
MYSGLSCEKNSSRFCKIEQSSTAAMLPENLRGGGRFVKRRVIKWRFAMQIFGIEIRTGGEQQLHNLPLIGMGGGVQWRCAPMVIVVLCLHR